MKQYVYLLSCIYMINSAKKKKRDDAKQPLFLSSDWFSHVPLPYYTVCNKYLYYYMRECMLYNWLVKFSGERIIRMIYNTPSFFLFDISKFHTSLKNWIKNFTIENFNFFFTFIIAIDYDNDNAAALNYYLYIYI